jgi:hypothetical protein
LLTPQFLLSLQKPLLLRFKLCQTRLNYSQLIFIRRNNRSHLKNLLSKCRNSLQAAHDKRQTLLTRLIRRQVPRQRIHKR